MSKGMNGRHGGANLNKNGTVLNLIGLLPTGLIWAETQVWYWLKKLP